MADVVATSNRIHLAYRSDNGLAWMEWNPLTEQSVQTMVSQNDPDQGLRPRIRLDTAGAPVVLFSQSNPERTFVARVDPGVDFEDGREAFNCVGTGADFEIDATDYRHVVCLHANASKVNHVRADNDMQNQVTQQLFAAQTALGDVWAWPTITKDSAGNLHVVAVNATQDEIWYQFWNSQTNSWLANDVLVDDNSARTDTVLSVALSVHLAGPKKGVGVAWLRQGDVHYAQYASVPTSATFGTPVRVDDGGTTTDGAACPGYRAPVSLLLRPDETAWINWNTAPVGLPIPVQVNQFRRWNRVVWTQTNGGGPALGSHRISALDLAADGTPWTCYFAKSAANPSQADLLARRGTEVPVTVATNVDWPSSTTARGCDIAVSPATGKVGVVYADTKQGTLRYAETANTDPPFLQVSLTISHGTDGNQAAAHLGLVIGADDAPRVVYSPHVGGTPRLRYARLDWTTNPPAWQTEVPVASSNIGTYPDITVDPADGNTPLISYYGKPGAPSARAWFVQPDAMGNWIAPEEVSPAKAGLDTRIAARMVGSSRRLWIAYTNPLDDSVEVSYRVGAGNWTSSPMEYGAAGISVEIIPVRLANQDGA